MKVALLLICILCTPLCAEELSFWGLGNTMVNDEVNSCRAIEPNPPFVIGKHNLGFANPSGAVRVQGMSGNCYTMAFVARLFYERATFQKDAEGERGYNVDELRQNLRQPKNKCKPFVVKGYESLFEMTSASSISAYRLDNWVDEMTRYRLGLAAQPPKEAAPANADELVDIYQMISTIHYLHYMQNQMQSFVGSALEDKLGGSSSGFSVTKRALGEMKAQLGRNELPLLLIYNPREQYGHVVLAYKIAEGATTTSDDVYVYDSNTQYGTTMDESIIRVNRSTGSFSLFKQKASDGQVVADNKYNGDSWFDDQQGSRLISLSNPNQRFADRELLANKLRHSDEETAYLIASGEFIESVTQKSPSQSSLMKDTKGLLLNLQNARKKIGVNASFIKGELSENSTITEVNEYLANNTEASLRTIFPYALPEGMSIDESSVRFSTTNHNKAYVGLKVTIAQGAPIDRIVGSLKQSAFFAGEKGLADIIADLGKTFKGEKISIKTKLTLTKAACSNSTIGKYAPTPILTGSHIIIGDMGSLRRGNEGDHCIEISESLMQRLTKSLLSRKKITGTKFNFDYDFTLLRRYYKRRGYVIVDSVVPECKWHAYDIEAEAHGFAPVISSSKGINYKAKDVTGTIRFKKRNDKGKNIFDISASFDGKLELKTGLGRLADWITLEVMGKLLTAFFPYFSDKIEDLVEDGLDDYLSIVKGSSVSISGLSVKAKGVEFKLDPLTVDLEATVKKFLGDMMQAEIKDVRSLPDRLMLIIDND